MNKNLLPLGSVVSIQGEKKRVMITGRIQLKEGDETIYDYSACYYPEGLIEADSFMFFQHEAISAIFYIGFQDTEEFRFQERLAALGELEVVDGKIVEVSKS